LSSESVAGCELVEVPEWAAWRLENTSSPLAARENLRSGCGESTGDLVAEPEETPEIGTGWERLGSSVVVERHETRWSSGRGWMVNPWPTEETPSFKEAREVAASSMLDKRPGNKYWGLVFLWTAKGISASVHLHLGGNWIGEGEWTGRLSVAWGWGDDSGREVGFVYGWNRERRGEWRVAWREEEENGKRGSVDEGEEMGRETGVKETGVKVGWKGEEGRIGLWPTGCSGGVLFSWGLESMEIRGAAKERDWKEGSEGVLGGNWEEGNKPNEDV
jgi:hypothetical protein